MSIAHRSFPLLVSLALGPLAAGATGAGPDFAFGFSPASVTLAGAPGTTINAKVQVTLETSDNPFDEGVASWALSVASEGAVSVADVTLEKTDAGRLYRDGFRHLELTAGPGNEGFICGVVLGFANPVTLPREGRATIATVTLAATAPAAGEVADGRLVYRDNLVGSGQPIQNMVVFGIDRLVPSVTPLAVAVRGSVPARFVRGDTNADGRIALVDVVVLLSHVFHGRQILCPEAADTDDDGEVKLADAVVLLRYVFGSGSPPAAPFPRCGVDPTPRAGAVETCRDYPLCAE